MKLTINSVMAEHFKGFTLFKHVFDGYDARITGQNGAGKTSVYDIVKWILFNKNSEEESKFGIRPRDNSNNVMNGLIVMGQIELDFDGDVHTLRKEEHEKIVKKQLRGYTNKYYLDEEPVQEKEYKQWIFDRIDEGQFRLLTDVNYFCKTLDRKKRRELLMQLKTGKEIRLTDFDDVYDMLGDKTAESFKKILKERRKKYNEEKEQIPPRIDELSKRMPKELEPMSELEQARDQYNEEIKGFADTRTELIEKQTDRAVINQKINDLEKDAVLRKAEIVVEHAKNPALDKLREETSSQIREAEDELNKAQENVSKLEQERAILQTTYQGRKSRLDACKSVLDKAKEEKEDALCPTCGLSECPECGIDLVADRRQEIEQQHKKLLEEYEQSLKSFKKELAETSKALDLNQFSVKEENIFVEQCQQAVDKYKQDAETKIEELKRQQSEQTEPDPENDAKYQDIQKQIKELQGQLGEPVADQLNDIEAKRRELNSKVNDVNVLLAQHDRLTADQDRINELKDREKELSDLVNDIDAQITRLEEFEQAENLKIEENVNGFFKHVRFKLFEVRLNESIKPICEVILKGSSRLSDGQKVFCGNDIMNTFSDFYGMNIFRFIDHRESLTIPLETIGQTIELIATEDGDPLKVENIE